MFSGWLLSLLAVAYLGCLFGIAFYGDRRRIYPNQRPLRPYIYSLALGVYCTSWTFFGAVGSAVRDGWGYLPIYLGPIVVFLFGLPFLDRLVEVGRLHKVSSIADFIASRFGKSRALAVLVTLIALSAAIPYIALQYKAVVASIAALTAVAGGHAPWYRDPALGVALILALFAVLFGARRVDATGHREGLMLAIAFESLLKLLAFVAVGVFACLHLQGRQWLLPARLANEATLFNSDALDRYGARRGRNFLSAKAVPGGRGRVRRHRRSQICTLAAAGLQTLFSVVVIPVVGTGGTIDGLALHTASDTLILTLPMSYGAPWLTVLVFLGGLSAATAMVVVASTALAVMISNDIAAPLLWRQRLEAGASLGPRVLWVRRAVIVTLALLSFAYYRSTSGSTSLAAIGLLAFAAVAQFAPGIIAALYWSGASRSGVFWGMLVGFVTWAVLLFLPHLAVGGLVPHALANYSIPGAVGPRALVALTLNVCVMLLVSQLRGVTLQERFAARAFVAPKRPASGLHAITATVGDLQSVAARIIGAAAAQQALREYAAHTHETLPKPAESADRGLLQHFERVLAGSIGASSARVVLRHALKRKGLSPDEVTELLDETSQELRFSRQLLQATMENVTQGISVVDAEMRIVAWNRRYLELVGYPDGMVYVGRPVAELIRWNAEQGELGPGDPEVHVQKRLGHMRAGTAYNFQRKRRNGKVYSIHGQPMSGGGYVATYTDITEFKLAEQALLDAKQGLEERVAQRTQELSLSLDAQRAAKQLAETANASKTRFVAAASHDLLQPINAARLFASALESRAREHPDLLELAGRIDGSMRAAEELLNDLLDIARLDSGALRPEITSFPIADLLEDLGRQYAPLAQTRDLRLTIVDCREVVRSDRVLLRRIVQNYISNALRYTERGGVVVGCRRREEQLEIAVYDTGPGVAEHERDRIYAEFSRLDQGSPWGEKGVGTGSVHLRSARATDGSPFDSDQPARTRLTVRRSGSPRCHGAPCAAPRASPSAHGSDRTARSARAVRGQRPPDSRWHGGPARHLGSPCGESQKRGRGAAPGGDFGDRCGAGGLPSRR